jgi:muramoyltetrapeptide carboxypeptidase
MRLRRGSRVAVVSPASFVKPENVERGVARLRAFGYEPVVMPSALERGPLYYAGTAQQRVADLHAAFADRTIAGVLCTRGGWGSAELLPLLDRELIRANPKVFVGYSDHTSLHSWFWNECRMPTYYAPMVAADWSRTDGVDVRSWQAAIEEKHWPEVWELNERDGMRVLREGRAAGKLLGGCLSMIEAGLGTPWALRIEEPCVLFVEDIGTKPYQWDRMLQHLRYAGLMEQVRGVVLGDMSANVEDSEMGLLESACLHALQDFQGPVSIGLKCGHVSEANRSLILGAAVDLICGETCSLEFVAG